MLTARYSAQPWAFDGDPPPSVRWLTLVTFNVGLVVATRLGFPHADWAGLPLLAAVFPTFAIAAFYAARSWSRPRPIGQARVTHRSMQAQSRSFADATYGAHVPMSFVFSLRASCVLVPTLLVADVGNYAFLAMLELHASHAAVVGVLVWLAVVALVALSVVVGHTGRPVVLTPFVVRQAQRTGQALFAARDHQTD